jgi:AcrR family transcriptional regulator
VKDLCDTAMINKTTFYSHYETIEHLHKAVCIDFATQVLSRCPYIDKIQSETRTFVYSILNDMIENMPSIEKLYGDDTHALVNDLESVLMEKYIKDSFNEDYALSLRFCIGGAFHLLARERDPLCIQKTVELIERVLSAK